MADPQDIVDIEGLRDARPRGRGRDQSRQGGARSKFLSIWFRCCHTYGRLYRNRAGTAYEGRCPRCGAAVRAAIGPGGTNRRAFEAR